MSQIHTSAIGVVYSGVELGTLGKIFLIVINILLIYKLWSNHKKTRKDLADIPYIPHAEPWRWSLPPDELKLTIENHQSESLIRCPSKLSLMEVICSFMGVTFMAGSAVILVTVLMRSDWNGLDADPMVVLIFGGLFTTGWGATCIDGPVISLSRAPRRCIFKVRQACFFSRSVKISASQSARLSFSGKIQSLATMTVGQINHQPNYIILINRRFPMSRSVTLRCTPSEGNWIVRGLNQWVHATSSIRQH